MLRKHLNGKGLQETSCGVSGLPAHSFVGPDGSVLSIGLDWDQIRKTVAIATDR